MRITKDVQRSLNAKLNNIVAFNHQDPERLVGIEIECEGTNLDIPLRNFWGKHADGSLRGESIEYVLRQPIARNDTFKALNYLNNALIKNESVVNESYRTSVHIHLNAQHMTVKQIMNQICLYMIFEDLLVDFCGSSRVGNLFCLRVSDAENLLQTLRRCIRSGRIAPLANDDLRYSAINVAALAKYGSLEFRSLRGTVDPNLIQVWINMLLEIRDAAFVYDNPQRICEDMSILGPIGFLRSVFSPDSAAILEAQDDIDGRMFDSVRLAQDIAYCVPTWDAPEVVKKVKEDDIFGFVDAPKVQGFDLRDFVGVGIVRNGNAEAVWRQRIEPIFVPDENEEDL